MVRRDPLLADRSLRGDHTPRVLRRTLPHRILHTDTDRVELRPAAAPADRRLLHIAHRRADAVALHLPHGGQDHPWTRTQLAAGHHRRQQGQCAGGVSRNGGQQQHRLPRTRFFQQPRRQGPARQHPVSGQRRRSPAVAETPPGQRGVLLPLHRPLSGGDIPDHGLLRKQFRAVLLCAQPAQLHETRDEPRTAGQRTDPLYP